MANQKDNAGALDPQVQEALAQWAQQKETDAAQRAKLRAESRAIEQKLRAPLYDLVASDRRFQEGQRELRELFERRKAAFAPPAAISKKDLPRVPLDILDRVPPYDTEFVRTFDFPGGFPPGCSASAQKDSGLVTATGNVQVLQIGLVASVGIVFIPPEERTFTVSASVNFRWFYSDYGGLSSAYENGLLGLAILPPSGIGLPPVVGAATVPLFTNNSGLFSSNHGTSSGWPGQLSLVTGANFAGWKGYQYAIVVSCELDLDAGSDAGAHGFVEAVVTQIAVN